METTIEESLEIISPRLEATIRKRINPDHYSAVNNVTTRLLKDYRKEPVAEVEMALDSILHSLTTLSDENNCLILDIINDHIFNGLYPTIEAFQEASKLLKKIILELEAVEHQNRKESNEKTKMDNKP